MSVTVENTDDPDFLDFVKSTPQLVKWGPGRTICIIPDKASLLVNRIGIHIKAPVDLAARDVWFERWASVLEPYLIDPRIADVFTFSKGQLTDPFSTHKSAANGPFPFPFRLAWPECGFCNSAMAFVCALDFRQFADAKLPGESLIYHTCKDCGCSNEEANHLTWLRKDDDIETRGEQSNPIYIARRWQATEYPTPGLDANEIDATGGFRNEQGIYFNFSCFADKIGGHLFWIQSDETPRDASGEAMLYIGQTRGSPDVTIGDTGLVYFFYSPKTGETKYVMQCF